MLIGGNEDLRGRILESMHGTTPTHEIVGMSGLKADLVHNELTAMREEGLIGYEHNKGWYRIGLSYIEE